MAATTSGKSFSVRQITKSNFAAAIPQIKTAIEASDFIAISTRKTGDSCSSHRRQWRRLLPVDTPETAYLKSKLSAQNYEILQFAVCPFSVRGSKVLAFPYNFHLFPRDELSVSMPSYSFSCQTSFLTSLAREGFDFNACVYDGISYLSRVQESRVRASVRSGNSSRDPSVADSIFMGRIRSRVTHWRNAFRDTSHVQDGSFVQSLRKLVLGNELYGSRSAMSVDICSERQGEMVFEMVKQISDDLIPILVPDNGGKPRAVRVVLTSSEEDKDALLTELRDQEEEQNRKVRGFRQVIDLISSSNKTIVSYNCLHDFTFVHEKFLGPLPATLAEFMCSLRLLFSNVIDLNHLMKEIGPLRKAKSIPSALSYVKRQFFVPIKLEVPKQDQDGTKNHGRNVLSIASLFAKLNMLLKTVHASKTGLNHFDSIEDYANTFHPMSITLHEPGDDDDEKTDLWVDDTRRVSTNDILFLWGFRGATSPSELKRRFSQIHPVFSEEFDVQIVDKNCAVVVFRKSGAVETLLKDFSSVETVSGVFREMIEEGLRAAGYDAYRKVCKLGLWEEDLGDSLEVAMAMADSLEDRSLSGSNISEIHWNSEMMIDLNDL